MAKLRRFRVESLQALKPGDALTLPQDQARHAAVLRIESGTPVELFDESGRCASAHLQRVAQPDSTEYIAKISAVTNQEMKRPRLFVAVGWPKGKRAAVLVEKCTELGVDKIIPVRYLRSVVQKSDDSQGLVRLRRIAVEAAKQCGRNDIPEISAALDLAQLFAAEVPQAFPILLDPAGPVDLPDIIFRAADKLRERPVLLIIGPEGGLAPAELDAAARMAMPCARMARHVLRVETAAMAACAITRALLDYLDEGQIPGS